MPQRHVSTTHSTNTLTVSRERQKPASSMVKPTCMPKTRNAAISVHAVFTGFTTSDAFTSGTAAAVCAYTWVKKSPVTTAMSARTIPTPSTLPASIVPPYLRHSGCRSLNLNRENFSAMDSLFSRRAITDICFSFSFRIVMNPASLAACWGGCPVKTHFKFFNGYRLQSLPLQTEMESTQLGSHQQGGPPVHLPVVPVKRAHNDQFGWFTGCRRTKGPQ